MAGKITAENALGQVLICLRMSNLNYIVKETPYSAYVTIRKKFVESIDVEVFERQNVKQSVENENYDLKQRVKFLGTECAMLKFEKEEIEIKCETLEREKISLEEQIEEEYTRNRKLVKTVENNERVIKDLKTKHEDLCKENSDNVLILESTLKLGMRKLKD